MNFLDSIAMGVLVKNFIEYFLSLLVCFDYVYIFCRQ